MSNKIQITIDTKVNAPIEKVWDYYTKPEHITKWNFASDDWECPSASNDLRAGGKYIATMQAKDGSFGFDFEAIYENIINNEKIAYTMTDGRQAAVSFNNLGDKTGVTITFDAETENPTEMQRDGWQSILNNFKKYVEKN